MLDRQKDRPGKIFVGSLAIDVDEGQLEQIFGKFGRITEILVIRDKASNQSRGFGFVTFENPLDAVDAEKEMNGKDYKHRALYVSQAVKPRSSDDFDKPSRGGSFRGRGGPRGGGGFSRGRGSFGGGGRGRDRSPFNDRGGRFSPPRDRPSRGGFRTSGPSRGGGREPLPPRGASYSDDRYSSRRDPLLESPASRRRDPYSPPREYGGRSSFDDRPILREDFSPPRDQFGSRSRDFDSRGGPPTSRSRPPTSRGPPMSSRGPSRDDLDRRDAGMSRSFRDDYDDIGRDYPPTSRGPPSRDYGESRDRGIPSRDTYGDRDHYEPRSRSPGFPGPSPRSRTAGPRDPPPRSSYPPSSSRSYSDQEYSRPPPSRSPPMQRSGDRYGERDSFAGSRRPAMDSRGPPVKKPRMDDFREPMDERRRGPPTESRHASGPGGYRR